MPLTVLEFSLVRPPVRDITETDSVWHAIFDLAFENEPRLIVADFSDPINFTVFHLSFEEQAVGQFDSAKSV